MKTATKSVEGEEWQREREADDSSSRQGDVWKRTLVLTYGLVCYVTFLGVFLYLAGFLGNLLVSRSIDSAATGPFWNAAGVNLLLVLLFGLQHSVMARPWFKRWWTRFVPPSMERSTYVMMTNLALIVLFWQWRPMRGVIWDVESATGRAVMYGLFVLGWLTVLATTFLINHFDLFGLRQVWLYFRRQPYRAIAFRSPGPYRYVRHPLYVGWIMALWATPTMTAAHLVFAVGMTAYILIAIRYEERDLVEFHGPEYAEYRRQVPMLIPKLASYPKTSQPVVLERSRQAGTVVS
jgi:methanethiol S-methyltransferase